MHKISKIRGGLQICNPPLHINVVLAVYMLDYLAVRRPELDMEGHLAEGVSGARQAGIVAADGGFDPVEYTFGDLAIFDVLLSNFVNRTIHSSVVITGSNDQINSGYLAGLIYPVMVD